MLDGVSKTSLPPGLGKRFQDFCSYGPFLQSGISIHSWTSILVSHRVFEEAKWARPGRG